MATDVAAQAHATAPPPRYTEGSLVKVLFPPDMPSAWHVHTMPNPALFVPNFSGSVRAAYRLQTDYRQRFVTSPGVQALEERGIGRPSTYAPTLQLLQVGLGAYFQCCILWITDLLGSAYCFNRSFSGCTFDVIIAVP